jgi:hypothetical protein
VVAPSDTQAVVPERTPFRETAVPPPPPPLLLLPLPRVLREPFRETAVRKRRGRERARDGGREQTDGRERETFGARTAAKKTVASAMKE